MHPENSLNQTPPPSSSVVKPPAPPNLTQKPDYPLPANTPPSSTAPPRRGRSGAWFSTISTLMLFLLAPAIALFIAAFVVQSYQVDGQSMEPTLQDNDRLIVNKWQRSWARISRSSYLPNRGDVIIFNQAQTSFGNNVSRQLIKRVMALPGERVTVANGKVTVFNDDRPDGFNPDASGTYRLSTPVTPGNIDVRLNANEVFVCGDNRANSEDSRSFGPIEASQIVGRLAFRIVPLDKAQKF